MSKIDREFNALTEKILKEGSTYINKNRSTTRLQIPSYTFRHSFEDGFPAISSKRIAFKSVVGELIWFLTGSNDVRFLNKNGIKIWNKDAYNWYKRQNAHIGDKALLSYEEFSKIGIGSVGQNYSKQWRDFNGEVDQISELVKGMKKDIMSSRLKVEAWNPAEIGETALPPCHTGFQIIGVPLGDDEFGFELHWNQRSVDVFLGLPFNIASYAVLAKILENLTGFKALGIQGDLKCVHLYGNSIEAAMEQVERPIIEQKSNLIINRNIEDVNDLDLLEISNFELEGYTSHKSIKVEMLAPNEVKQNKIH